MGGELLSAILRGASDWVWIHRRQDVWGSLRKLLSILVSCFSLSARCTIDMSWSPEFKDPACERWATAYRLIISRSPLPFLFTSVADHPSPFILSASLFLPSKNGGIGTTGLAIDRSAASRAESSRCPLVMSVSVMRRVHSETMRRLREHQVPLRSQRILQHRQS